MHACTTLCRESVPPRRANACERTGSYGTQRRHRCSGSRSVAPRRRRPAGEALKCAPGGRATFTSADASGLIYDAITVTPTSLAARGADWAPRHDRNRLVAEFRRAAQPGDVLTGSRIAGQ
ncbi:hypothetical protein Bamb_4332 [Burkholderia ambifaria AMMD]|uniref:Uncharacterized protein n=1 Tax=Burkholderia ambifaria (strain ATCC BAA-244 / DSM 16087 / CCUG 44356 / LMG 19182 / AMMD) TaxID=339670 RepID=Q0B7I9_BURCM|nr:hypothetical protein Bamb_4332 [Burkholderia ambifaria AMMD]